MANLKLNSNRAETKSDKIKRNHTLRKTIKRDQSLLRPATDLSDFSKKLFYTIKNENKQLSNSDNYLLNLLCSEYDIYINSLNHLNKNGLVVDGKKSPYYGVLKQSIDEITKLSNDLSLTPKNRINSDYKSETHDDPLKAVVR